LILFSSSADKLNPAHISRIAKVGLAVPQQAVPWDVWALDVRWPHRSYPSHRSVQKPSPSGDSKLGHKVVPNTGRKNNFSNSLAYPCQSLLILADPCQQSPRKTVFTYLPPLFVFFLQLSTFQAPLGGPGKCEGSPKIVEVAQVVSGLSP
jgi:hypothetical protein